MNAAGLDDLACLEIEVDTNWCRDERGRLSHERVPGPDAGPAPYLLWARAKDGQGSVHFGARVTDDTRRQLLEIVHRGPDAAGARPSPGTSDRLRAVLEEALGSPPSEVIVPCWVVEQQPTVVLGRPWRERARVVRSDEEVPVAARTRLPPNHIDERRGPWAGVMVDDRMVSACSTARSSEGGVEAGTWTEPSYRGQGFAAASTAAWASMLLAGPRLVFYCTDDWNTSSAAVAARLGLRFTGWMWRLDPCRTAGDR